MPNILKAIKPVSQLAVNAVKNRMTWDTLNKASLGVAATSIPYGAYARGKRMAPQDSSMERLRKRSPIDFNEDRMKSSPYFNEYAEKNAGFLDKGINFLANHPKASLSAIGTAFLADQVIDAATPALKPTLDTAGYKLYQKIFPGGSGAAALKQVPEEALKTTATQFGKSLGDTAGKGVGAFINNIFNSNKKVINQTPRRKAILEQLRREDMLIKEIPLNTALEAYHSMVEVAPTLSTDKNAVKSFLRTVATSPEGGIDWNTLKGLADAETSIMKSKGHNSATFLANSIKK